MDNKRKKKYIATDSKSVVNEPAAAYLGASTSTEKYLTPDADLARAITMEELLVGVKEDIRKMYRKG